jgi:hypothetical protein
VNYVTVIHSTYFMFGSRFVSLQIGPLKANVYGKVHICVCMSVCIFVLKKCCMVWSAVLKIRFWQLVNCTAGSHIVQLRSLWAFVHVSLLVILVGFATCCLWCKPLMPSHISATDCAIDEMTHADLLLYLNCHCYILFKVFV